MEYILKILAGILKPTKPELPAFGFTQLQPAYVNNIKESTHKKY